MTQTLEAPGHSSVLLEPVPSAAPGRLEATAPAFPQRSVAGARVHLAYVDGMRALAALYVMFHHAFCCIWASWIFHGQPPLAGAALWLTVPVLWGHFAVTAFLVISGFCLALPAVSNGYRLRGGIMGFYSRRMKRIVPPYMFGCALSLLLIETLIGRPTGSHWDQFIPVTRQDLLAHLFLIHNLWGDGIQKINGAYWSIAVEWQIYFLMPLFLWICRRMQPVPGVCLIVTTTYILLHFLLHTFWARLDLAYYAVFAMGVLGAAVAFGESRVLLRLRNLNWCAIGGALALLAAALCLHWGYHVGFTSHGPQLDGLVGMAVMALLIACAVPAKSKVRAALSWRPLVWIGTFSYSLYLVHEPIQQAVWQYGVHPMHWPKLCEYLALLTFGSPIIVGAAYLFYLLCERPFMNTTRVHVKAAQ